MEKTTPKKETVTPMMAQWWACKEEAKEALLLFRLGDFYEAFYDDAKTLSKELELTLTKRQEIPMAGVPYHAAEGYIEKLVAKGYLIAIAEQVEDPKETKGIVKRKIVRTISPGTIFSSLPDKANNYFACLTHLNATYAIALIDLTTGAFIVSEHESEKDLLDELYRRRPAEVLISHKSEKTLGPLLSHLQLSHPFRLTSKEPWHFELESTTHFLTRHFSVHTLDGFGLKGMVAAIPAAGALLAHIAQELSLPIDHIKTIGAFAPANYMAIDYTTQRNLDLDTLFNLLDTTHTPMGGRLLRSWVYRPLLDPEAIGKRQEAIAELIDKRNSAIDLAKHLSYIRDIERLIMRIATGNCSPRDLSALRFSLEHIPSLDAFSAELLTRPIPHAAPIIEPIASTLVDEPPFKASDGGLIREGVSHELDELRSLRRNGQAWLANYQARIKEETGIKTLKVSYNKAFGYYIEVSRAQSDRVPETFIRRQTLVNAERFISPELKEYEEKILTAEEKIATIEQTFFASLRERIAQHIDTVVAIARRIAELDTLLALAEAALRYTYVRPTIDTSHRLDITQGRHPVIEESLPAHTFIPNDTHFASNRLFLITGPNMAGKSTYIRQVAILTLMAQMGSYIPAQSAHIGIVDKLFSRIGASDDLARGQSTFMVEMTETANILRSATPRSLVILDEIGRGTSTYDGISIAWAVAEHLLRTCKTLFATHYWELTELEKQFPEVANYTVAVSEESGGIAFLHRIIRGGTDKSYGIHVARLAGLPTPVLKRASELLRELEQKPKKKPQEEQLNFFAEPDPVHEALKKIDLNETTPLEALQLLNTLKCLFK